MKTTIQAIRIEHPDSGWGLFRHRKDPNNPYMGALMNDMPSAEQLTTKHRSFDNPWCDSLIQGFNDVKHFCAFKSIEQIQEWIDPAWFNEIFELGFQVLLLELSECQIGEMQIVFEKQHIITSTNISDLFITNEKP